MDFANFYQDTSPRMVRYAYGLTGDLAQAQDVAQEAYVRAWQNWRRLSGYEDAEAWLRLVVSRLVFDWWRHLRVRRNLPEPALVSVPAPSEETVLVVAAMKKLPERQRQALALHYLLDISVAEIAAELSVSPGTVKSWLSRGRDNLAEMLREEVTWAPLPSAETIAQRGQRRRRTQMVVTATAAGLAVIAVVVFAWAVLGHGRTMPTPPLPIAPSSTAVSPSPQPSVQSTAAPTGFTPLHKVRSTRMPLGGNGDPMKVDSGRAVVGAFEQHPPQMAGLDLDSGAVWQSPKFEETTYLKGIVANGIVAVTTGEAIWVLDPRTGQSRWHRPSTVDPQDVGYFPGVVTQTDRAKGKVIGYDLMTGKELWQFSTPVQKWFGMITSADLAGADGGGGVDTSSYTSPLMFIADGRGKITEYSTTTGTPTGRSWTDVPTGVEFLAAKDEIMMYRGGEAYRLDLAAQRPHRVYAGDSVQEVVPCGEADMCLVDGDKDADRVVVAVHGDQVKWTVRLPGAVDLGPIAHSVRVSLGFHRDSLVLDEQGRESLRLSGQSQLLRLDGENLLGVTVSGTKTQFLGISVATMQPTVLGTVTLSEWGTYSAEGRVLVTFDGGDLTTYRIR